MDSKPLILSRHATAATWQESLKRAVRRPEELLQLLRLSPDALPWSSTGIAQFPLFVPREFVDRMEIGNPRDPLLMQVWPFTEEGESKHGDLLDPVGDAQVERAPGLLHKYDGRVLLIASGACAVHCRYCFRRHFPYEESPKSLSQWSTAIEAIRMDSSVREVILSGGDPLSLVDSNLQSLIDSIEDIPHVQRLRIHTRFPVVIPNRITDELLDMLGRTRLTVWCVLHINHRREIDESLVDALDRLRGAGVSLLNQAVLLRGINDSVDALTELFEKLIDLHIGPYYLHQLDRVQGAAHWEVPVETGRSLIAAVRERLPGYAVPTYVKEIAGEPHKTPLT